jgi:hypothetical protein
MQNFDYSKKYKRAIKAPQHTKLTESKETPTLQNRPILPKKSPATTTPFFQMLTQQSAQPLSFVYLFIGAVLFFTSGLILGLKIDQKETHFASNEYNSFKNIDTQEVSSSSNKGNSAETFEENSESSYNDDSEDSFNTKDSIKKSSGLSFIPKNLQFPPKLNQVNYIIQLGSFTREEATRLGAALIRERQEFQGRIFRTTTGKLYLGYYYDLNEAKATLKKVRKLQKGSFSDASIKNIQF